MHSAELPGQVFSIMQCHSEIVLYFVLGVSQRINSRHLRDTNRVSFKNYWLFSYFTTNILLRFSYVCHIYHKVVQREDIVSTLMNSSLY